MIKLCTEPSLSLMLARCLQPPTSRASPQGPQVTEEPVHTALPLSPAARRHVCVVSDLTLLPWEFAHSVGDTLCTKGQALSGISWGNAMPYSKDRFLTAKSPCGEKAGKDT